MRTLLALVVVCLVGMACSAPEKTACDVIGPDLPKADIPTIVSHLYVILSEHISLEGMHLH